MFTQREIKSSLPGQRRKEAQERRRTGIPEPLQRRFEMVSGYSFDNVRVHYDSAAPARLGALREYALEDAWVRNVADRITAMAGQYGDRLIPSQISMMQTLLSQQFRPTDGNLPDEDALIQVYRMFTRR